MAYKFNSKASHIYIIAGGYQLATDDSLSALRQKDLLRIVTENASVGLVILNRNRRYTFANAAYARILGLPWTTDELIGKGPAEVLASVYETQISPRLDLAFAGERVTYELTKLRSGTSPGETVHYEVVYEPTRDGSGAVDGVIVTIFDITGRKRAETAQYERGEQLRNFIELSPVALAMFDRNMHYLHASRRWKSDLKMGELDPRGQSHYALFPDIPERWKEVHRRGMAGEILRAEEDRFDRLDGSVQWFRWEVQPWREENGNVGGILIFFEEITERKQAEAASRDRGARLRQAIKAANVGLWDWDIQTNTVWFSPEWKQQIGYEVHEISNSFDEWRTRVHPEDLEKAEERVRAYLEKPWPNFSTEFRFRHKDGSYRWILAQSSLIYGVDGKPVRMLGSHLDITERKRSEVALKESEDRFRTVVEASPIPKALNDQQQNITYLNSAFTQTFGYDKNDIPTLADWWPKAYPDSAYRQWVASTWQARLNDAIKSGTPFEPIELNIRCKDGSKRTVLASAKPLEKAFKGEHLVVFLDITVRKQSEETLLAREVQFRTVVEAVPVCLIMTDETGQISLVNAQAEKAFGYTRDELVGKPIEILVPQLIRELHSKYRREFMTNPQHRAMGLGRDLAGVRKDGTEFPVEVGLVPVSFGTRIHILASIVDISARKQAEEDRLKLEAQIRHAQKLESLGVLAGGIAHDFNNILSSIMGYSDLALMKLPPDSPARPLIAEAIYGTRSASELTKQMLAYSGKGKFVVEALNLNALIEDIFHLLHVSISKRCVLNLNLMPGLPLIEADASQIRQIIMNLVINASDAIGDRDGVITASTGSMYCDRAYLSETFLDEKLPEGLYVYLEVTDTGGGMSEDTLTRIFDPFFTTKATGRGLGLAAVLGIVRGHHGALKVTSEVGKGTTFKVALPAIESTTGVTPTVPSGDLSSETGWGSGTVLIVDDEETVREMAGHMLETMGFSVLGASDGREGVDVFRKECEKIRLVVLDLTMPNMDGIEAFRAMRSIRGDMKAILSSGYNEQSAIQRSAVDLAGFIQKPYTYKELCAVIRTALGK